MVVMTSKADGAGRRTTHLANDHQVDDEDGQRNDGKRRQVRHLPDVVLHQPLLVVVVLRLRVVVLDSQEVVVLELRPLEVGSDQLEADLDDDASDHLRRENLQRLTSRTQLFHLQIAQSEQPKQFDKKAASPPHMNGSIVFARLHQCSPHLT